MYLDTFYDREPDHICEVGDSDCKYTSYDIGFHDGSQFAWTFAWILIFFIVWAIGKENKEKK